MPEVPNDTSPGRFFAAATTSATVVSDEFAGTAHNDGAAISTLMGEKSFTGS